MSHKYEANTEIYHIKGTKVLIEVDAVPITFGGLIQIDEAKRDYYQLAQTRGVVRAIGPHAWFDKGEPYAKVGDIVMFPRYAGYEVNRDMLGNYKPNEPVYKILDDFSVECVIEKKEDKE